MEFESTRVEHSFFDGTVLISVETKALRDAVDDD
jgi:hypothetical protein